MVFPGALDRAMPGAGAAPSSWQNTGRAASL